MTSSRTEKLPWLLSPGGAFQQLQPAGLKTQEQLLVQTTAAAAAAASRVGPRGMASIQVKNLQSLQRHAIYCAA
jgi:hypothetical protein